MYLYICKFLFSSTQTWSTLPQMPRAHSYSHAGLVQYPDSSLKLIVAGGLEGEDQTDIYDFNLGAWLPGPLLPYNMYGGESVPFMDTFLIVGGSVYGGGLLNTVLEYDPVNIAWINRTETMDDARRHFAAFMVPDGYVTCS